MKGFATAIRDFSKRTGMQVSEVRRMSTLQLLRDIVHNTPVKTGRARGNWQVSIGKPITTELDVEGRTQGSKAFSKGSQVILSSPDDKSIFITNNLKYIRRLEYGWSKKAPSGMVRISIARWMKFLREAGKKGVTNG